jgi:hypothetical protein
MARVTRRKAPVIRTKVRALSPYRIIALSHFLRYVNLSNRSRCLPR